MKNKEKFAKEIVEIAVNGFEIAVDKKSNLTTCHSIKCTDCSFFGKHGSCYDRLKQWAESEYVEPKVFTEEEKAILIALPKINWVARDRIGKIFLYTHKPAKSLDFWTETDGDFIDISVFSDAKFSAIKWEDSEPTRREEILR